MRRFGTLAALVWLILGCSNGEDLPLTAPGVTNEWPVDPGWVAVPELFTGATLSDGVWVEEDGPVILVGGAGTVWENEAGQWTKFESGHTATLNTVVEAGAGEFLAVGDQGGVLWRSGGKWRREESGTTADLTRASVFGDVAWAVGEHGVVVRRENGIWSTVAKPGRENLVGVAALGDSVFVAALNDSGRLRVWDGENWGVVPPGPWGRQRVRGIVTNGDGNLYAAADSLYVRSGSRWQTITNDWFISFFGDDDFRMKTTGSTIWYGDGSWSSVDPVVGTRQSPHRVRPSSRVMAPLSPDRYLTATASGRLTWQESGESRIDLEGRRELWGTVDLVDGTMMYVTAAGVFVRDRDSESRVLSVEQLPELFESSLIAGCGLGRGDFYLMSRRSLYHCLGGEAVLLGTWDNTRWGVSLGVTESGALYLGDSEGLWAWRAGAWHQELPVLPDEGRRFSVSALGNGHLAARDENQQHYILRDGLWLPLGEQAHETVMLTGEEGQVFAVQRVSSGFSYGGRNSLFVLDEEAWALREVGDQGMGVLRKMSLHESTGQGGEALVLTQNPTMVFRLHGAAAQADWRVVAGPLDADISHLVKLQSGELLALGNDSLFYIHRP